MNFKIYKTAICSLCCAGIFIVGGSCRKFLETGAPPTQLVSASVFENDITATAAQLNIYAEMEGTGYLHDILQNTALSADEMINHSTLNDRVEMANNTLTPGNGIVTDLWNDGYKFIYQANAVWEGLERSAGVSPALKIQLQGESRFIRAWCHFNLLLLFGEIPIITETAYEPNALRERKTPAEVYARIEDDLLFAMNSLAPGFPAGSERVRPTKYAASALLARVYLYQGKYAEAEAQAGAVIGMNALFSLVSNLDYVFLKNSAEAIWQLMAVRPRWNTYSAVFLVFNSTPSTVSLAPGFVSGFTAGDNRRNAWIRTVTTPGGTYHHAYKYKVGLNAAAVTEYTMVLRLAEQYLVRAEARAAQDNLAGALADLNFIRARAGLPNSAASTKEEITEAIQEERRAELFCESGDRWFNLKRTGNADAVLGPLKGSNWTTADQLYPIPQEEINRNPNLYQNPGY